jgi:hypothetical protein
VPPNVALKTSKRSASPSSQMQSGLTASWRSVYARMFWPLEAGSKHGKAYLV